LTAALLAAPGGVGAQTRTVVVPADAAVVVPPRGSALPRPAPKPIAQHRPRLPPMAPARDEGGTGFGGVGTVAGVVLPAIAAAAMAAVLSNGNGGAGGQTASGPVRTR
jgi:hypothetical protein